MRDFHVLGQRGGRCDGTPGAVLLGGGCCWAAAHFLRGAVIHGGPRRCRGGSDLFNFGLHPVFHTIAHTDFVFIARVYRDGYMQAASVKIYFHVAARDLSVCLSCHGFRFWPGISRNVHVVIA
jgi:hypothetical protein